MNNIINIEKTTINGAETITLDLQVGATIYKEYIVTIDMAKELDEAEVA